MFVLDTNVLSELRRPSKAKSKVLAWAEATPEKHTFLSAITILEIEQGVLLAERKDASQGKILRSWLDSQVLVRFEGRILSIDASVAKICAGLHVPDPRSERDALIAATAMVHGMTIVTRNVSDFAGMAGARLLNPWG